MVLNDKGSIALTKKMNSSTGVYDHEIDMATLPAWVYVMKSTKTKSL